MGFFTFCWISKSFMFFRQNFLNQIPFFSHCEINSHEKLIARARNSEQCEIIGSSFLCIISGWCSKLLKRGLGVTKWTYERETGSPPKNIFKDIRVSISMIVRSVESLLFYSSFQLLVGRLASGELLILMIFCKSFQKTMVEWTQCNLDLLNWRAWTWKFNRKRFNSVHKICSFERP